MMGLLMVLVKNMALLFLILILSLSLLPNHSSNAARPFHCENKLGEGDDEGMVNTAHEVDEVGSELLGSLEVKHERVLRANARDYGRYNPAPALRHPHSKLIPRA